MFEQIIDPMQKKKFSTAVLAVFVLLALFLGIKALSAIKEFSYIGRGTYATNVITVTGYGEVLAIPDIGSFSFSVIETAKTVPEAQDKAGKKVNAIITTLKEAGIEEKDIKTTSYNSYPKYEYTTYPCVQPMSADLSGGVSSYPCRPSKNVLTGYEVSQSISVKVRKTEEAGAILTKVGTLGAENISGLDFVVDDMEAVKAEARDKAIADAKEKAKILSKSLDIKLRRIVNFYESGDTPVYYGLSKAEGMGGDSMYPTPPQTPVGEDTITSNVSITYEVD